MKKEYLKPLAEFVSLAAAEQIATGASYYDDGSTPDGTVGTTSNFPGGWWGN